jgi:xanthine/CO dehydrogenase XdhC/CoxF family maturation factor
MGDGDATEGLREVARLRRSDALVLLTHNWDIDAAILGEAIRQGAGYVGALGSRATQAGRRERLAAAGLTEAEAGKYHGPVGLDIGAANPAETALAICAEIIAELRQRKAAPLTGSKTPINAPGARERDGEANIVRRSGGLPHWARVYADVGVLHRRGER